nr:DNA polymerase IV [Pseudoglutamicibacter albus]
MGGGCRVSEARRRPERVIAHVDIDAFFVSVERILDPTLQNRPIIVSQDSPRAVVLSASYDVRAYGVHSGQPVAQAKNMAPHALIVPPTRSAYGEASARVMEVLKDLTPLVEQVSVDEAFMDITGVMRHYANPFHCAQVVRERIKQAVGLPASVGLAPNKFLAKMASDKAKPDGVYAITPADVEGFMQALPVGELFGVGKATEQKLHSQGLMTAGDVAQADPRRMLRVLGKHGPELIKLAQGIDPRPVVTERVEKSISHEHTFDVDVTDEAHLRTWIKELSFKVAERVRAAGHRFYVVGLKVRWDDFTTVSRQRRLSDPTDSSSVMSEVALSLLSALPRPLKPVRLIGVRAGEFASEWEGEQLMFEWEEAFSDHSGREHGGSEGNATGRSGMQQRSGREHTGPAARAAGSQAEKTMDAINARFKDSVRPASLLRGGEGEEKRSGG